MKAAAMLIAQITDLHLRPEGMLAYDSIDPMANARAAIEAVNGLVVRPDMLVLTGDLADQGEAAAYTWLDRELGRHDIPAYVIPGNHDLRAPMRQAFGHRGYLAKDGFLHYVIEAGPVRLIALDTVIEHETGGRMCAERCSWLADRLAEDRRTPTIIMLHHQPILTGGYFDTVGIDGREALEKVVAGAPNIHRMICGHMHRGVLQGWGNTVVSVCPSTAFQFDLEQADPSTFRVRAEPPAYQLHHWAEETGLVTYTGIVGTFPQIMERPNR
jgi:3',5'-cyclic-AMP phosphodiesterase